jgi:hypothetical protein
MTALQDKIYGREIDTGIRKVGYKQAREQRGLTNDQSQVVIGRGGSGNARKSISSASTISSTTASSTSTAASRFLGSLGSRGTATASDRSGRTRRWSSASGDFMSVINIAQEVGDSGTFFRFYVNSPWLRQTIVAFSHA